MAARFGGSTLAFERKNALHNQSGQKDIWDDVFGFTKEPINQNAQKNGEGYLCSLCTYAHKHAHLLTHAEH